MYSQVQNIARHTAGLDVPQLMSGRAVALTAFDAPLVQSETHLPLKLHLNGIIGFVTCSTNERNVFRLWDVVYQAGPGRVKTNFLNLMYC
ncbi:hypothetical protein EVAR_103282_1 [Eumeta japonica]|uniref:Uncharacterized protein n=1 Tax=Eumeta variegata TaxID=151549 RepID=A0A4C1XQG5_EUMVA|nr:hypothetical protein EVAR_103282_1 [Eumeta japonica]